MLNVLQDMEYPHNYNPNVSLFPKKKKKWVIAGYKQKSQHSL